MGLFGSMVSGIKDFGGDMESAGSSMVNAARGAGAQAFTDGDGLINIAQGVESHLPHELAHTTQQLEGPVKNVVTEAGEDVGKVGSEASEETASGLEAAGVPDGVAEAAGLGAEVMADGAIAAA